MIIERMTSPSRPVIPAVLAPTMILVGATTEATAAPAVCPAKMITSGYCKI